MPNTTVVTQSTRSHREDDSFGRLSSFLRDSPTSSTASLPTIHSPNASPSQRPMSSSIGNKALDTLRRTSKEIMVQFSGRKIYGKKLDQISPHALDRLGVKPDLLKQEKGMKKLGISDVHLEQCEQIRRYSGVIMEGAQVEELIDPHMKKAEAFFGFTSKQRRRIRGLRRLGTSEQEVLDDYARRISALGLEGVY